MVFTKKIILSLLIIIVWVNSLSFSFLNKDSKPDNNELIEVIETHEEDNTDSKKIINVGDIIEFGNFYNLDEEENIVKAPIKWRVLDKTGELSLLITEDIIKTMPFNYLWSPTNWRESNIRLWLNYDFYDIAFNSEEKELIQYVTLETIGNYAHNIHKPFETKDHVFLLSVEEARKYYTTSDNYMAVGTEYAKKEGLWISKYVTSTGYSVWWLRSPGQTWSSAAIIHAAGNIGLRGDGVATRGNGVRPCIWIKLVN